MEHQRPVVDVENCTGCVACVDACNPGAFEMVDGIAVLVRPDACLGNEHCVAACPTGAIGMQPVTSVA